MHRNAEKYLSIWQNSQYHKPLYVTGMRGTGKTTLIIDFLRSRGQEYIYINLETGHDIREYLQLRCGSSDDLDRLIGEYYGLSGEQLEYLIVILDEIHCLKAPGDIFRLTLRKRKIILIDSEDVNEDIFSDNETYVNIALKPLSFGEYLDAVKKEWYREVIEGHFERRKKIPDLIHGEICDLFEDYIYTGGMPAIIKETISDPQNDRRYNTDELLLKEYRNICAGISASGKTPTDELRILNAVASNMALGNNYLKFSDIRKGTSLTYYKNAISSLENIGAVVKTEYNGKINLYLSDTGILGCLLRSSESCSEQIYDHSMKLNHTAAELSKTHAGKLSFWHSKHGARVEFIIEDEGNIKPVKILNETGKNIRSLQVYYELFHPEEMIAVGNGNFNIMGRINVIPQYAVFCL